MLTASVILCTRNRLQDVRCFLQSLVLQEQLPQELIIVDSSDQPIYNAIEDMLFHIRMKFHYEHSQPGLTLQRNIGIKRATSDIIFFFDDDVILDSNYIKVIMEVFENNDIYLGGMGTIKYTMINKWRPSYIFRLLFLMQRDGGNGVYCLSGMPKHPYGTGNFTEVQVLGGALMAYRKNVFNDFKCKFDENVTGYASQEDVDFSYRVSRLGKLFFSPDAELIHNHSPLARDKILVNRKMYMVNYRYFYFKNFYPTNKISLIAHWWTIIGLLLYSLFFDKIDAFRGYIQGLVEFYQEREKYFGNHLPD